MRSFRDILGNFPYTLARIYMKLHSTLTVLIYQYLSMWRVKSVSFSVTHYCRHLAHVNASNWVSTEIWYLCTVMDTVHTNRGVPPHPINEALDTGSPLFVRNKNMLLVRLLDKNEMMFMYWHYFLRLYFAKKKKEKKRHLVGEQVQFYYKP